MSGRSILHIEDDDGTALLVQTALQETGAAVHCYRVSDVEAALEFLSRTGEYWDAPEPNFILLDLNLPGKSGLVMLRTVRESKSLDHIPVVVFTSSAAQSDRDKSLALGASAYICKPSTFDEYIRVLREVMEMIPEEQRS